MASRRSDCLYIAKEGHLVSDSNFKETGIGIEGIELREEVLADSPAGILPGCICITQSSDQEKPQDGLKGTGTGRDTEVDFGTLPIVSKYISDLL